jgi:hypothetical protein
VDGVPSVNWRRAILIEPDDEGAGFSIKTWNYATEGSVNMDISQIIVSGSTDKRAFANLVYQLADIVGFSEDAWGKENLRVSWDKPGHEVGEDGDDDEEETEEN